MKKSLSTLAFCALILVSCDKDDDNGNTPPVVTPPVVEDLISLRLDGETYTTEQYAHSYNGSSLDFVATFNNNLSFQVEIADIPEPGTYTGTETMAVALADNQNAWYGLESVSFTIIENNPEEDYINIEIEGELTPFLGGSSRTLNKAIIRLHLE